MLIMKCPECQKYISSALLAEIPSINCDHCGTNVSVDNVLVTANGFTFGRKDLLKRFFRYRKLLDEVIEERNNLGENPTVSKESKHSIEQFLNILQGMMSGARDHFRCRFDAPVGVRLGIAGKELHGDFADLSMTGACILIDKSHPAPRVKSDVSLNFYLPEKESEFALKGQVCWLEKAREADQKQHRCGIRFFEMPDETGSRLWDYISMAANEVQH